MGITQQFWNQTEMILGDGSEVQMSLVMKKPEAKNLMTLSL
jgi:hypothetical protein